MRDLHPIVNIRCPICGHSRAQQLPGTDIYTCVLAGHRFSRATATDPIHMRCNGVDIYLPWYAPDEDEEVPDV